MKKFCLLIAFTICASTISAETVKIAEPGTQVNTDLEKIGVGLPTASFASIVSMALSLDKDIDKKSLIKYYNLSMIEGDFNPEIFKNLVINNKKNNGWSEQINEGIK
jgi:hypothetical protein